MNLVPHDLHIDHLPGDDFGRVSLVMDGRRVLLNFVPEEAQEVVQVLRRGKAEQYKTAGGPGETKEAQPTASPTPVRDTVPPAP